MQMLVTFAALSLVGTVILSMLPEGSLRRAAGMTIGLLSLMCWAEGIAGLLQMELSIDLPKSLLVPTCVSVESAEAAAAASLSGFLEVEP